MEICPKCLNDKVSVKFYPKGTQEKYYRPIEGVVAFMRNDTYYYDDEVKIEHLIYTCDTCGYKLAEKCKDKE